MRPFVTALSRASVPALLVAAGIALAPAAGAHNPPPLPTPADGATVTTAPDEVVLTFTDVVLDVGAAIKVTAPDGSDVTEGTPVVDDTVVTQALAKERPAGEYSVAWRVTSADGHPVDGTFTFTASDAAGAPPETPSPTPSAEPSATPTPEAPTQATPAPTPTRDDVAGLPDGPARTIVLVVGAATVLALIPLLVRRLRDTKDD
ncbi:hypothetical protein ATL41_1366 [Flavimobilis soli]|uniref:CopC domain-containing protein n=1 Tax=Flavimobilis soli TaxID=442709 RepID=A0A2A9ECK2_9MICO|nr:copper resistance CopC family protein [Flavimobilis soli]PFG36634.1 hypothetical protein ATL41_1366 [Flavimobilis soli]